MSGGPTDNVQGMYTCSHDVHYAMADHFLDSAALALAFQFAVEFLPGVEAAIGAITIQAAQVGGTYTCLGRASIGRCGTTSCSGGGASERGGGDRLGNGKWLGCHREGRFLRQKLPFARHRAYGRRCACVQVIFTYPDQENLVASSFLKEFPMILSLNRAIFRTT